MRNNILFYSLLILGLAVSCKNKSIENKEDVVDKTVTVPVFNPDNAYKYIEKQLSYGPRVPNTIAQDSCAAYLKNTLQKFLPTVMIQETKVKAYNGKLLTCKNIIASYKPETNNRILLCAHWDSRPVADQDPNPINWNKPVPGANDGASGVGILLEVARVIKQNQPEIGVDIIFFDCEDYGTPKNMEDKYSNESWCLGSQYWAKNPHKENYYARYGILLDMVGAKNAVFPKENYSVQYASDIVNQVWASAAMIGYSSYFIPDQIGYINDDHIYINTIKGIPTIDIIHLTNEGGFFPQWHTVNDDINQIDRNTLKAVGQTLLEVIYKQK